jgi:hypothetical protein
MMAVSMHGLLLPHACPALSLSTVDSAIEAANRGAYSYLLKPYDMNLLLLDVKRALEKQRTEQALRLRQRAMVVATGGKRKAIQRNNSFSPAPPGPRWRRRSSAPPEVPAPPP